MEYMKIIETKVYTFNELSDKAKERAREWFKNGIENETFWSDCVIEDCTAIASLMGFEVDHIYFRGFWSQGDGACLVGKFRAGDVKFGKVKEFAPNDEWLHSIVNEFEHIAKYHPTLYFKTTHSGHYYHENSVIFDFEEIVNDKEINNYELFEDVKEVTRKFMKWIYKRLETEWEYQNSNECIDENIICNEYTFTENGKHFC